MDPARIQRRRTKGWQIPENTVCVDRKSGFGNPFRIEKTTFADTCIAEWWVENSCYAWRCTTKEEAIDKAVMLFRHMAMSTDGYIERIKAELKGKSLACWCKPYSNCHADVLLEIANA